MRSADAAAREQALDPTQSFIVQAPAGSGKTELLTQRFLALLARVQEPESVLAITFTRKAAAEMRTRVLEALAAALDPAGDAPADALAQRRCELARAALEQDRRRGWRLLENGHRLRIQTIDALSLGLVRRMPWLSRLGGTPTPADDGGPLYRQAARAVLTDVPAGLEPALRRLLLRLDNNSTRLEDLLAEMLGRRDQWLRLLRNRPPAQWRDAMETRFQAIIAQSLDGLRSALSDRGLDQELLEVAAIAAANLRAAGSGEPLAAWLASDALPGTDAAGDDLRRWRLLSQLLLTKQLELRKRVDKNDGFPPKSREKERMTALLAAVSGDAERWRALHHLPAPRFQEDEWAALRELIELMMLATAELRLVFQSAGATDFIAIHASAAEALGSANAPSALAFALDGQLRHLLVDEFQDTSQSQWALLAQLVMDWGPDDGRTVFLVGDPMQSIYGFRQAEVGLFGMAQQFGLGPVPLVPLRLSRNFRSAPELVAWTNAAFERAFPPNPDWNRGEVDFAPAVAARSFSGEVHIHGLRAGSAEDEALRVTEIARTGLADGGSVAILARNRAHLADIMPALQRAAVPFQAVEMAGLEASPIVRDLRALTRALLFWADRASWLALLRAPWCGLTLEELWRIAARPERLLWERLNDAAVLAELPAPARTRLERLRAVLQRALACRGRVPLRDLIEATWLQLGGPACLHTATELDEAADFFTLLESVSTGNDLEDAAELDRQMDRLHARPALPAGPAVQVMTIHKAKGLEFDTVILPGLARPPRSPDHKLLRWMEHLDEAGGPQILLAPMPPLGSPGEENPTYRYLGREAARRQRQEEIRVLYVAATRARRHLHLIAAAELDSETEDARTNPPCDGSLLRPLWLAVETEVTRQLRRQENGAAPSTVNGAPAPLAVERLPLAWAAPPWPAALRLSKRSSGSAPADESPRHWPARPLQRQIGVVAHEFLRRLGRAESDTATTPAKATAPTLDDRILRQALRQQGVPEAALDGATATLREVLRGLSEHPRGRWILAQNQAVESESNWSATAEDGRIRHLRIDRAFIAEDGTRWIIDFKTSTHQGADVEAFLDEQAEVYRPQLGSYAQVFRRLEPERPIRCGLFFPLLGGWREWAHEG